MFNLNKPNDKSNNQEGTKLPVRQIDFNNLKEIPLNMLKDLSKKDPTRKEYQIEIQKREKDNDNKYLVSEKMDEKKLFKELQAINIELNEIEQDIRDGDKDLFSIGKDALKSIEKNLFIPLKTKLTPDQIKNSYMSQVEKRFSVLKKENLLIFLNITQ